MTHISFECEKTNEKIKIPINKCKKRIVKKLFGKGPTVFYCETTGKHAGNVYQKLETIKQTKKIEDR